MNARHIIIFSFCLVLSSIATGGANYPDRNNLITAYDFYLGGNKSCHDGKYDQAIGAFIKSTELDPDYYYARINLGVASAGTGKFRQAVEHFTFCINKKWGSSSDRFVFYFNRSLAAAAAGDKRQALNDQAALEKLDPIRAGKVKDSRNYILMDVEYVERRNLADKDRLLNTNRTAVTKGKIVIRQVAELEKTKQEYEAIGLISGTVKEVTAVLEDFSRYPEFMPDVEEITVRIAADGDKIVDYKLGLPFGYVKKYRLKFHSKNEDGRTLISWHKLPWPGLKADQTVVDTYGQWIIEEFPSQNGQVLAYYRVYTDTGKIPLGTGWIVDAMTTDSIKKMFEGTQGQIEK